MPRTIRPNLVDIPQHVIQRGNNRCKCFTENGDYAVYLDKLYEYSQKFGVQIHAFVLMTNHVHLLMTPLYEHSISLLMQALGRYYVRFFNSRHKRTGTLWEGRFKSSLVDTDSYFLQVMMYIELNPVRANMVKNPGDYKWSSFQGNGADKDIKLLVPHRTYLALGVNDKDRLTTYNQLILSRIPKHIVDKIRQASRSSSVFGRDEFKIKIENQLNQKQHLAWGGDRRSNKFQSK